MSKKDSIQTICILGIGGVGGYFGGKIAYKAAQEKDQNRKVFFIGRGAHLETIKSRGLMLRTLGNPEMVCRPTAATSNINEIPSPDLCLVCVKSYDLDDAVKSLGEKIRDDTLVIPLLNGVDVYDRIRARLNKGIVLPACVYVGVYIDEPGVVTQEGGGGLILCGKDPLFPDFNPAGVIDFFDRMGISFQWNDDPFPAIWEKYVFIAAFGLVTAYSEKTLGQVVSDDALKDLLRKIMAEIVAIAEKKRIRLAENIIDKSIEKAGQFKHETKTSFQRDIESKKNRNEGDLFGGTIIRFGQQLGVPTPETQSVYSKIQQRLENSL